MVGQAVHLEEKIIGKVNSFVKKKSEKSRTVLKKTQSGDPLGLKRFFSSKII